MPKHAPFLFAVTYSTGKRTRNMLSQLRLITDHLYILSSSTLQRDGNPSLLILVPCQALPFVSSFPLPARSFRLAGIALPLLFKAMAPMKILSLGVPFYQLLSPPSCWLRLLTPPPYHPPFSPLQTFPQYCGVARFHFHTLLRELFPLLMFFKLKSFPPLPVSVLSSG